MIPNAPPGIDTRHDTLASLPAKLRWLHAYARLRADRYMTEKNGTARLLIGAALALLMLPVAFKVEGMLAGYYMPVAHESAVPPAMAIAQWVVYLAILIISAIISVALAPKVKDPEVAKGQIPEADDGKSVREVFGTVWVDDPMVLGYKAMGTDPIKSKGGKK